MEADKVIEDDGGGGGTGAGGTGRWWRLFHPHSRPRSPGEYE